MNVLVIGSGGREHVLAWKLRQSDLVDTVYCFPGNGGMIAKGMSRISDGIGDFSKLTDYCINHDVGLVVVGPEKPLCDGIVDIFRDKGLAIFGPTKAAAQLEGSKWFAKEFMQRHEIPTAHAAVISDMEAAKQHIKRHGAPIVVKADGLASGKGVTVASTEASAIDAIERCLSGTFGESGKQIIIEECLEGDEISVLAFLDNGSVKPLVPSRDYKRLKDGDAGPNTGGMGAYSSPQIIDDSLWQQIIKEILDPFCKGCQKERLDYRGLIYVGIILTKDGPKVLEFNVRFGDPETQAVLSRLESDLAEAMLAAIGNRLSDYEFVWSQASSVCVVLASGGYPGKYETGHIINGVKEVETHNTSVFHAGTEYDGLNWVTIGGRVLGVTSRGKTIKEATLAAYRAVEKIHWPGMYYRKDIAMNA